MKGLIVIGGFFVTGVLVMLVLFWLAVATGDDGSARKQEVPVGVISAKREIRASSTYKTGFRIEYGYQFQGTTYTAQGFAPQAFWQPGEPLMACINPDHPTRHALHLRPEDPCGTYVGEQDTATPMR